VRIVGKISILHSLGLCCCSKTLKKIGTEYPVPKDNIPECNPTLDTGLKSTGIVFTPGLKLVSVVDITLVSPVIKIVVEFPSFVHWVLTCSPSPKLKEVVIDDGVQVTAEEIREVVIVNKTTNIKYNLTPFILMLIIF
jgi:hypothetical protein